MILAEIVAARLDGRSPEHLGALVVAAQEIGEPHQDLGQDHHVVAGFVLLPARFMQLLRQIGGEVLPSLIDARD